MRRSAGEGRNEVMLVNVNAPAVAAMPWGDEIRLPVTRDGGRGSLGAQDKDNPIGLSASWLPRQAQSNTRVCLVLDMYYDVRFRLSCELPT
jgi:hypothetical protein